MKHIKQSLFLLVATLGVNAAFAQLGVGITNTTNAAVNKTVKKLMLFLNLLYPLPSMYPETLKN